VARVIDVDSGVDVLLTLLTLIDEGRKSRGFMKFIGMYAMAAMEGL
jgi:hypothetical protein